MPTPLFFALPSLLYHGISGHGWDDKVLLATVAGPPVKQERQKILCDILVAIPSTKWVEIQQEINTKGLQLPSSPGMWNKMSSSAEAREQNGLAAGKMGIWTSGGS